MFAIFDELGILSIPIVRQAQAVFQGNARLVTQQIYHLVVVRDAPLDLN